MRICLLLVAALAFSAQAAPKKPRHSGSSAKDGRQRRLPGKVPKVAPKPKYVPPPPVPKPQG